MPKTCIIIVTYNAMQWAERCFSSVRKSSVPVHSIVIDNGSSDGTQEYIKTRFPEIEFIQAEKNLGFGKANNLGLKKALELGGDYFFLLNQDAWTEENTIELLVEQAEKNPQYGIISPMHLNGKGTALDYNFSNYIAPNHCKNLYSDFVLNKVENKIYESGFICAAAWLLTKNCLKTVGGFSPTFFHYAEDDNYVHRLLHKGLKIGVVPSAKIYHDRENRTGGKPGNEMERDLFLKYSSPENHLNIDIRIKQLKFRIMKNFLLGKGKTNEILKKELDFLTKNKEQIQRNFKLSISDKEFVFLDD
ncbi:MAG: glycosyltransferase family 2 protein [Bergeyella sp.]